MRGVSPIVATVLLILISIATSLILWSWVTSTISQTPSELPFLSERVKIEAVSIESNVVRVYVRNLVNNDVRIGPMYLINGSSGLVLAQNLSSITVKGGEVVEVSIELRTLLPRGVYIAKVTTARGYESSYVFAVT